MAPERAPVRTAGATILSGTFAMPTGCPNSRNATSSQKWRQTMLMKILAASALTIGLATSAMAQSNGTSGTDGSGGSGRSVTVDPNTPASPNTVDPAVTNSTTGTPGDMNSNA